MIHYNDAAIQRTQEWLVEKAMKPSTSPRLAGHLFEASETIAQLKKELNEEKAATAELHERIEQLENEETQAMMDGDKVLNDLESAIDEIWKQKAKLYDANGEDYIRGQMNLIQSIQKVMAGIKRKNEPPEDPWEWVRMLEEELKEV